MNKICHYPDGPRPHLVWSRGEEVLELERCVARLYYFGQYAESRSCNYEPQRTFVLNLAIIRA